MRTGKNRSIFAGQKACGPCPVKDRGLCRSLFVQANNRQLSGNYQAVSVKFQAGIRSITDKEQIKDGFPLQDQKRPGIIVCYHDRTRPLHLAGLTLVCTIG